MKTPLEALGIKRKVVYHKWSCGRSTLICLENFIVDNEELNLYVPYFSFSSLTGLGVRLI